MGLVCSLHLEDFSSGEFDITQNLLGRKGVCGHYLLWKWRVFVEVVEMLCGIARLDTKKAWPPTSLSLFGHLIRNFLFFRCGIAS